MARAYRANDAGFRAIAVGPEIRKALAEIAEKGKGFAEAASADFADSGDYGKSFEVTPVSVIWTGEYPGPRAAVQLQNTSDHAAAVEWGRGGRSATPTRTAHRVLGRTLEFLESEGKA